MRRILVGVGIFVAGAAFATILAAETIVRASAHCALSQPLVVRTDTTWFELACPTGLKPIVSAVPDSARP